MWVCWREGASPADPVGGGRRFLWTHLHAGIVATLLVFARAAWVVEGRRDLWPRALSRGCRVKWHHRFPEHRCGASRSSICKHRDIGVPGPGFLSPGAVSGRGCASGVISGHPVIVSQEVSSVARGWLLLLCDVVGPEVVMRSAAV